MIIAAHPFGTEIDSCQLQIIFASASHWEEHYRQLILLSRRLPRLDDQLKQPDIELSGCENRVWLGYQRLPDGKLHFYGDSEGRIVKGLLAILLTEIEGKTADQLLSGQPLDIYERLGIWQKLSSSRNSGLQALLDRVKQIAHQEQSMLA